MAKSMAQIENGTVVNLIWCGDDRSETEHLINTGDRGVWIGDSYAEGRFFRDGAEILTPPEIALEENRLLRGQVGAMIKEYGLPASLTGIINRGEFL